MRPFSLHVGAVLLLAAVTSPRLAGAEPPVSNKVAAEALYEDAKTLLNQEKWQAALEKLLASQRLDPAIGTLLNIAYCYEKLDKTASAWASYNEVVGLASSTGDKQGRGERAAAAAKALEPKLARVVLRVPPESRVDKLELRRDGDLIDPGTWDTAIPTDPGMHAFEASAPGRVSWKSSIQVAPGPSTMTLSIPVLVVGASPSSPSGAQRTAGIAVAGVGLAGVIVGAIFGGLTIAKKSAESAHCQKADPHLCDATGVDLRSQALTFANVSNVGFAVGGAALVTGVALFFTAPKPDAANTALQVSPLVAARTGGALISGRW
jgi:serine/threonine-protein kinase